MKKKSVAATLALFMGIFGVHRFYLGQRFLGILYMVLFFITFTISVDEHVPAVMIPALLGFIDAVLLSVMPLPEFDEKYNRRWMGQSSHRPSHREALPQESYHTPSYSRIPRNDRQSLKRIGIERFRAYDFEGAIHAFEDALELDETDASLHFNLACCFGMLEQSDPALFHLEKAVELGFTNLEKIHQHDALAFVRSRPEFDDFVANGYHRVEQFAPKAHAQPDSQPQLADDLLEQIIKLGSLREKGILTEQEFAQQKKKILGE